MDDVISHASRRMRLVFSLWCKPVRHLERNWILVWFLPSMMFFFSTVSNDYSWVKKKIGHLSVK